MSFSQGSAPEPAELVKRWLQGVQQDTPDTNVVEPAPSWEDLATTHAAVNASGKDYDQHAEENKAEGMCADSYKEERVLNCFYNTGHLPIRPHSPSMRNSRAANHREGEYHIIEGARPEEDKNRKRSHEQVNPSPPSLQDAVGLRKQPARSKDGSDITDPSDKYARKPRRKTRPDRYEYKEDLQRHTARRGSKKVDHKKSGTMLNDEFRAPNVGTGRLTLKPTLGPGMFANGKSSAPMRGQGLPDLSFSEMNFLKKRSLRYHTKLSNERQTKNSKDRSHKPPKDEISSFFSQPLHIEQKMTSAYQTPLRRHDKPTPSPIRRPDRSWRLTDPECSWQNDSEIPILKHFRPQSSHRKSTMSHNDTPTSCVSWSTSPSRKPRQVAAQQRDSDASSHTWKKRNSPLAPERCQIEDSTSIYPQSSVTNRFLEDWATNALLGGVETFGQQGKLYISLEELKALAEERMEHDAPTNASQVELPKTLPSPQPDRQVTAMGDSGEVQDAGQSVTTAKMVNRPRLSGKSMAQEILSTLERVQPFEQGQNIPVIGLHPRRTKLRECQCILDAFLTSKVRIWRISVVFGHKVTGPYIRITTAQEVFKLEHIHRSGRMKMRSRMKQLDIISLYQTVWMSSTSNCCKRVP
ncbi:hypothetical protein LTR40_006661 [Exophiala xenobiotica]|nr:hypothetical protein LTR40_006661 [Exophiala xenobiotica]